MITLGIFLICYLGFILLPEKKTLIAVTGALLLILTQEISWVEALKEINWNVMGLFIGTLILAELFMYSRTPAVLAEWLVDLSGSARSALIAFFALAGAISMFVENVAVVLLIAPVALTLCEKLSISPVRPLILLAMFSNLQGAATLIGDPPSMLLASFMGLTFGDFFIYQGKPSLFFITQVGCLSALLFAFWIFREERQKIQLMTIEKVISWIPLILLVLLIIILALGSPLDPTTTWLAGAAAMILGLIGMIWHHFGPKWQTTEELFTSLDWKNTFFLMALFVLIGGLRLAGWMDKISDAMIQNLPDNLLLIYGFIILLSLLISAVIDNVPFLIAMIPIIQEVATVKGYPIPLLAFALLIGTCLGGNITPIGASANIVAVSFLEKNGHKISFPAYVKIGLLFTLSAVIPAALFLWFVWS